jgi:anion-transporting  ArsA/GET3 family ATPase
MGLYFFSGKGGVGKTHLATSYAVSRVQAGFKVLLVEFSQQNQYSEYFSKDIGFAPVEHEKGLFLSSWTGKDCLREYVGKILRSQKASDFFMKISAMEKLIDVAPGLKEIAVLGKLTSDYREINFSTDFDDIIFDSPASGHFVSLLTVPESLGGIVGVGPMKNQCADILEVLNDKEKTHFALIEDGSSFSSKESVETRESLEAILIDQDFHRIKNYEGALEFKNSTSWFQSAKNCAEYWKNFKW